MARKADQLCGSLKEKTAHPHLLSKEILLWNSLRFHIGLLYISWEPDTPKQTKNASEEGGRESGPEEEKGETTVEWKNISASFKRLASPVFLRLERLCL